jgi:hypothetical protein
VEARLWESLRIDSPKPTPSSSPFRWKIIFGMKMKHKIPAEATL